MAAEGAEALLMIPKDSRNQEYKYTIFQVGIFVSQCELKEKLKDHTHDI